MHIDKLEFNADGTIKPIVGTRAGVEQVEAFDPYRTFEAETLARAAERFAGPFAALAPPRAEAGDGEG